MRQTLVAAVTACRREQGLCFAALLSRESILEAFGSASSALRGWLYTPAATTWVFLSQCLSPDHSCREAVARFAAWLVGQGKKPCSSDTGAYCTARDHLPEEGCRRLVRRTGQDLEGEAPPEWLWKGHRVRVVDGSTITMPDTPENQAEYPQSKSQAPGCGFPIARIVVVFSLAVGTVLEAALGRYTGKLTGENSLLRTLSDVFCAGDIVLGDRCFSGWFDIALLQQRGGEVVVRKHHCRPTDFRRGRRLSRGDHLVEWAKPERPKWMSPQVYAALPSRLIVREVRVRVTQPGFRTETLIVVTTLRDADEYTAADLADLYRRRWQAELNLRSIKTVLQMDQLRCQTPHRVRNEFWMHLLAYNLIRRVMAQAAFASGAVPWQISFKGALQTLNQFLPIWTYSPDIAAACEAFLRCVAANSVGNRPDRIEPRRIKRRPKTYGLLRKPRAEYKRQMC